MEYQVNTTLSGDLPKRKPLNTDEHPLEKSERTFESRQRQAEMNLTSKTFGIGFTLHLKHERAAARCPQIGHLGVLKRHDAMYNSLTGRDLDFDFKDVLAVEPEVNLPCHTLLENLYDKRLFPK